MVAPKQEMMVDGDLNSAFGAHDAMLVKQTMRGCLRECMGCEAKSEFNVAPLNWANIDGYRINETAMGEPDKLYALEESSFCMRCCCRDGRAFDMVVQNGQGGTDVVHYKKPLSMPLYFSIPTQDGSIDCPCCCFLPKVETMSSSGQPLGSSSRYICDQNCCVPKLKYAENEQDVYTLKPETCCGGCCIACNCKGKGGLFVPFYFHDPVTSEPIGGTYQDENTPQIRKVWAGMKKECCSTADTFAVKFPAGVTPERKAGLLGLTFLLDFTVFERQGEGH